MSPTFSWLVAMFAFGWSYNQPKADLVAGEHTARGQKEKTTEPRIEALSLNL